MTKTDTTDRTHRVLTNFLRRANGGCEPSMIRLTIGDTVLPADADEIGDRRQRLHVTTDTEGRLVGALGIATHWKMLWSEGLRFAIAPSEQFFLQSFDTPPVYAWVEDDRFMLDRGSLLPTASQRHVAMAAFDADFAVLMMGAL
ncbi:hypothetical protein HZF05_13755 [Sphingomonas sp. CGMCC 1.13654]|uniref:Uncharacterized protein n=1 Tax=Sphingomonas chungangi TaxID=2683589 RepID=A0A838L8B2_9SPHN|nr:hypothetical protein [Sphingomonas chungangi]MBA2935150.1 hypothetical protein [Sphingomonas chungangi]MVW57714.1 hypothetical protein [Sphingomonas chungangi]